jgi:hypothetical protein
MRVWIGEPDPQSVVWVYHPSAKTKEEQVDLLKKIDQYGYSYFMVELYSVDDIYWVEVLDTGAKFLEEETGVQFHINVHVRGNNQEVIDFINKSPYLEYVPIVRVK